MAKKVNVTPAVPTMIRESSLGDLVWSVRSLVQGVVVELTAHARRLNGVVHSDGTEAFTAPFAPAAYLVADLPDPALYENNVVIVTNDVVDGVVLAVSDGVDWLKFVTGGVVA